MRKGVCTFSFSFHLCWKQRVCQKKICVSLFPIVLFCDQVLCTVIAYLVGVEVVGVLVE